MQCPDLKSEEQSLIKGRQRTEKAINMLGMDVMAKIYSFVLYSLGYSYEYIAKLNKISKPGVKRTVNEILNNGISSFLDKRRKTSNLQLMNKIKKKDIIESSFECREHNDSYHEFKISGHLNLKIRKDDSLTKKLITLLLLESGFIGQQKASEIIDCHRNTVRLNLEKYKAGGVKALFDGRVGLKEDYKFNSNIKTEIIIAFIQEVLMGKTPTKGSVCKSLKNISSEQYSQSAVASHLKKIGLTENKEYFIKNISRQINEKIDSLEFINHPYNEPSIPNVHIEPAKNIKENLRNFDFNGCGYNLFGLEGRVENIQSELQPVILESLIKEMQANLTCPVCNSRNVDINNCNAGKDRVIKTSFGGDWKLSNSMFMGGKCKDCGKEFDVLNDLLKLPEYARFTPLTQKKICSANIAKSYEAAATMLKQQIGLNINRKQVRNISVQVGNYIYAEFKEIYEEISKNSTRAEITARHPLVDHLKIEEKYLDRSKYLITLAADGGRMRLVNWIPSNEKYKKSLQWHENKVFRISIYDKKNVIDVNDNIDGIDQKYQCAKIIPELTVYGATNETWKGSAPLIQSHLFMLGIGLEDIELCLSDGSEHIMQGVFSPLFPNAVHLLDYYHKSEALHSCLKSLSLHDNKKKYNKLKKFLWEGEIESLVKNLKKIQLNVGFPEKGKRDPENPKVKLDNLINHLNDNKERLRYKQYRDKKYPIGSGSVESAVKLFGKRIKGTEKQWNEDGGESILHLYSFLLSKDGRWDKLWKYQTPWIV